MKMNDPRQLTVDEQQSHDAYHHIAAVKAAFQDTLRASIMVAKSHGIKFDFHDIYDQLIDSFYVENDVNTYQQWSDENLSDDKFLEEMRNLQKMWSK